MTLSNVCSHLEDAWKDLLRCTSQHQQLRAKRPQAGSTQQHMAHNAQFVSRQQHNIIDLI
jgi:hypothetical protein